MHGFRILRKITIAGNFHADKLRLVPQLWSNWGRKCLTRKAYRLGSAAPLKQHQGHAVLGQDSPGGRQVLLKHALHSRPVLYWKMLSLSERCHPLPQNKPPITPIRACNTVDKRHRWAAFHTSGFGEVGERDKKEPPQAHFQVAGCRPHSQPFGGCGEGSHAHISASSLASPMHWLVWVGWGRPSGSTSVCFGKSWLCPVGLTGAV